MTINEFLRKLRALKMEWRLGYQGRIRANHPNKCCPITALAPDQPGPGRVFHVWHQTGLNLEDTRKIIQAADNGLTPISIKMDGALRKRLLKACKLENAAPASNAD